MTSWKDFSSSQVKEALEWFRELSEEDRNRVTKEIERNVSTTTRASRIMYRTHRHHILVDSISEVYTPVYKRNCCDSCEGTDSYSYSSD